MQPKTPLFTSGSQHPPRFGHAVYLGGAYMLTVFSPNINICFGPSLLFGPGLSCYGAGVLLWSSYLI